MRVQQALEQGDADAANRVYTESTVPAMDAVARHLHEAIAAEDTLVQAQFAAREVFEAQTLPRLAETRKALQAVRERAEGNVAGTREAGAIFAAQTTPALHEVQGLLGKIVDEAKSAATTRNEEIVSQAGTSRTGVVAASVLVTVAAALLAMFIIRSLVRVLKRVVTSLSDGAEQVNDASSQVSVASQQLADGASEQASSLEETSAALEEMTAMTRTNAENAKQANQLADQASAAADEGEKTMVKLNDAMQGIQTSSEQIGKVIKVIEEIAFQTNLLALNAAVEAARAGEHGKGFAVVADEVRNLAMRAAEAAKETTGLIERAAGSAREGVAVADEVGQALGTIVGDVTKVTELINGITQASQEQAQGADQVNIAVAQIDKVTQQNAASAEESASAAEELSAQSEAVKGTVNELVALVGGNLRTLPAGSAVKRTKPRPAPALGSSGGAKQWHAPNADTFQADGDDSFGEF